MRSCGAPSAPGGRVPARLAKQEKLNLPQPWPAVLAGNRSHGAGPGLQSSRDQSRTVGACADLARPMQGEASGELQTQTKVQEGSSLRTRLQFPKSQKFFIKFPQTLIDLRRNPLIDGIRGRRSLPGLDGQGLPKGGHPNKEDHDKGEHGRGLPNWLVSLKRLF